MNIKKKKKEKKALTEIVGSDDFLHFPIFYMILSFTVYVPYNINGRYFPVRSRAFFVYAFFFCFFADGRQPLYKRRKSGRYDIEENPICIRRGRKRFGRPLFAWTRFDKLYSFGNAYDRNYNRAGSEHQFERTRYDSTVSSKRKF